MLIEIKMADGEKLRMDVIKYEIDTQAKLITIDCFHGDVYFNANQVAYIGAVEWIYTEGQEKMEPVLIGDGYADGKPVYDFWECPGCGEQFDIDDKHNFCPKCGQALEWEENYELNLTSD